MSYAADPGAFEFQSQLTLADVIGVPFWLLALIVAILIAVVLFFLEKRRPWREIWDLIMTGCLPEAKEKG